MSAFVVDPQTINTILNALRCAVRQEGRHPAKFPDLRYLEDQTLREQVIENPGELGRVLYAMNINAVEQRYPGDRDLPGTYTDDRLDAYVYHGTLETADPIAVFQSLACYLYQCTEGDVDELPLYKAVKEFKNALAEHIVMNTKEFEKAYWG